MKRRLFAKNLAALLAIPFVAKTDEYAPKVGKEVTRSGVKEVSEIKFPGNNTLVMTIDGEKLEMLLSEVTLENNRNVSEFMTKWEPNELHEVYLNVESHVWISGRVISNTISDWFGKSLANFTVFLEQDHRLEGIGFITEVREEADLGGITFEFCIQIEEWHI